MEVAECSPGEKLQILKASASASMAYAIPQFPAKWQSIKDKLQQLCSNLNASGGGNSDEHLIVLQFLQTAMATVSHIQAIASLCSDESYNGGRLRLRSDLDNISSKLDVHLKDLKEMVSSRIPMHSQAVVATRPAIDASLGNKRFYINDLFLRMRIGDSVQRSQTLATIGELLCEGDACIQEQSARIVSIVASYDSFRGVLVKAGVVSPLVQLLDRAGTSTVSAKERAAQALKEMTSNSDNVWAVCAQGGPTMLLNAYANVDSSGRLVTSTFAVLNNLSMVEEVKMFMVEEGAVSELVKFSRQKEEERKVGSAVLLHSMSLGDANVRQAAICMGVIQSLIQLINPDLPYSSKAFEVALSAIQFFCFPTKTSTDDLISSNFLSWLIAYLNNGDYAIMECTLKSLIQLTRISAAYNKMVGGQSRFYDFPGKFAWSQNLPDEDNLNRLLQSLEPGDGKDLALSAIMSSADTSIGRNRIISSEHFGMLKELADSGDLYAKKIIKKLSANKLQSILTKIRIT